MNDTTYNGHANRETWAFQMHWANDYDLYNGVLNYAKQLLQVNPGMTDQTLGRNVRDRVAMATRGDEPSMASYFRTVTPEIWRMMRDEVGDFHQVSETEVGEDVREALGGDI